MRHIQDSAGRPCRRWLSRLFAGAQRSAAALAFTTLAATALPACAQNPSAKPEVRGTWITTTANTHIATPENTAETMRRLREIGLNSVYVETWKNGYTQFPSETLERLIGVRLRPSTVKQDPSDPDGPNKPRDLLQETLVAAHANQLAYIAWFEYGFMAAHQSTMNELRTVKPDWISRDIEGNEIAPNGFVWLNPLHPQARRFLVDIVLEAIDKYDLDGVQLDDRIVWPYVTMGYDDYTRAVYANEHGGKQPPTDHTDPEWIEWRSQKIDEYAEQFVAEIRAKRPGLIVSVSPAPYPWVYENYCLDWPSWARDGLWDEYIPQCYRYDFPAFKATWDQQLDNLRRAGGKAHPRDMLAGVLTTGSRPDPVPWADLEQVIDYVRETNGGGHVWWFSRGVLDEYPGEITALYNVERHGHVDRPDRPKNWRPAPIQLTSTLNGRNRTWSFKGVPPGSYRLVAKNPSSGDIEIIPTMIGPGHETSTEGPARYSEAMLLVDRRPDMEKPIR